MVYFSKWKVILVLGVVAFGLIFAVPNLFSEKFAAAVPEWLPHKQVNLGLDLQGGSHLLLEVDVKSVLRERLTSAVESVRSVLRGERIRYTGLGLRGDAVSVTIREAANVENARQLILAERQNMELVVAGNQITLRFGEDEVNEQRRATVEQSIEIVRRRIDETGTREPTIQQQGDDRILLQLPGVDDPDATRRSFQSAGSISETSMFIGVRQWRQDTATDCRCRFMTAPLVGVTPACVESYSRRQDGDHLATRHPHSKRGSS